MKEQIVKTRILIFVFALVVAFSAGLFFQQEVTAPTITSPPPLIDKPVIRAPEEKVPKIEDYGVDWQAMRKLLESGGEFTTAEEAAWNELHVIPLNWVDQTECDADGYCVFQMKYPPHPYETIPQDELRELAYNDPLAAVMMGMRFAEDHTAETSLRFTAESEKADNERIGWFLRAAALSGKTGPLMRLAGEAGEMRYNANRFSYGAPEPSKRTALVRVAKILGDPRANPQKMFDEQARQLGFLKDFAPDQETHDQDIAAYHESTEAWYQYYMASMESIQSNITGSTQVNEFVMPEGQNNE
jgi:hypothetical protein